MTSGPWQWEAVRPRRRSRRRPGRTPTRKDLIFEAQKQERSCAVRLARRGRRSTSFRLPACVSRTGGGSLESGKCPVRRPSAGGGSP